MFHNKIKKGFSLVEMLAVIALLGIIAILGVTAYGSITQKVKEKNSNNIETKVFIAAEKYNTKTGIKSINLEELYKSGYLSESDYNSIKEKYTDYSIICVNTSNKVIENSGCENKNNNLEIVFYDKYNNIITTTTTGSDTLIVSVKGSIESKGNQKLILNSDPDKTCSPVSIEGALYACKFDNLPLGKLTFTYSLDNGNDDQYSVSKSITYLPEEATYTLTYDANGGENAPDKQTGSAEYEISEQKPTWSGRIFAGWVDNVEGKTYLPKASITLKQDTTLSAIWETYTGVCSVYPSGTGNCTYHPYLLGIGDDTRYVLGEKVSFSYAKNNSVLVQANNGYKIESIVCEDSSGNKLNTTITNPYNSDQIREIEYTIDQDTYCTANMVKTTYQAKCIASNHGYCETEEKTYDSSGSTTINVYADDYYEIDSVTGGCEYTHSENTIIRDAGTLTYSGGDKTCTVNYKPKSYNVICRNGEGGKCLDQTKTFTTEDQEWYIEAEADDGYIINETYPISYYSGCTYKKESNKKIKIIYSPNSLDCTVLFQKESNTTDTPTVDTSTPDVQLILTDSNYKIMDGTYLLSHNTFIYPYVLISSNTNIENVKITVGDTTYTLNSIGTSGDNYSPYSSYQSYFDSNAVKTIPTLSSSLTYTATVTLKNGTTVTKTQTLKAINCDDYKPTIDDSTYLGTHEVNNKERLYYNDSVTFYYRGSDKISHYDVYVLDNYDANGTNELSDFNKYVYKSTIYDKVKYSREISYVGNDNVTKVALKIYDVYNSDNNYDVCYSAAAYFDEAPSLKLTVDKSSTYADNIYTLGVQFTGFDSWFNIKSNKQWKNVVGCSTSSSKCTYYSNDSDYQLTWIKYQWPSTGNSADDMLDVISATDGTGKKLYNGCATDGNTTYYTEDKSWSEYRINKYYKDIKKDSNFVTKPYYLYDVKVCSTWFPDLCSDVVTLSEYYSCKSSDISSCYTSNECTVGG